MVDTEPVLRPRGDAETHELWKNSGEATVVIKKRGEYGIEIEETVTGMKSLHITPADRRMNQEAAAMPALDVFSNGMLTPVRLIEGEADLEEMANNPNLLTEDDMRTLVKAHPKTFEKRIGEITNPVLIKRLVDLAHEEDCTVKRVEALNARLGEVTEVETIKHETRLMEEPPHDSFKAVRA